MRVFGVLLLILLSPSLVAADIGSGVISAGYVTPPPLPKLAPVAPVAFTNNALRESTYTPEPIPEPIVLPQVVITPAQPEPTPIPVVLPVVHDAILDAVLLVGGGDSGQGEQSRKSTSKQLLSAGMPDVTQLVTVIGSLILVIGCFLLFSMLLRKVSPHATRTLPKELFENLGRVTLTPKIQLQLLRLGNRLILVSVTLDGATSVTEITDPDEVMQVLGMCKKLDANSATTAFRRVLSGELETRRETSRPREGLAHLLTTGLVSGAEA